MFQITTLKPGDAYEPKVADKPHVSIQVGIGGDCGIFMGKCEANTFRKAPAFRVLVNEKDLRRHWKKVGNFEMNRELQCFALYGETDIGSDARYMVTLENVEIRVPIEESEFKKLERLSAWETIHIMGRIKDGTQWF
jgi:hypothetical protein